jgi:crotonobetainyl-CoA:carnitine CoA-transferase CaiB-like acyl-CoA transferase
LGVPRLISDTKNPRGIMDMTEQQGLEGVRVLEVGGGVGLAYVAKLFGDLGADVVRYEGEGDDRVRERPHDVHRWVNTNKRSITSGFAELVAGADILLHDRPPAAAEARGLTYDELAALAPRLVVCSFTPFGMTGPYAHYAAEEITTIHASSWGFLSPSAATDPELPPLKAPGHHSTLMVANVAATAALAAFDRAERTGVGDHVDFSVFAAAAKITETAPAGATFSGSDASRLGVKSVVPWGTYHCRGGMVQLVCPEQQQWESLLKLMGDPEWAQSGVFDDNDLRRENSDLVELYVSEWMADQDAEELYHQAQAARLCLSPVNTMSQMAADTQFATRGFFADTPDGLRLPGPGFQLDQPWWAIRRRAPARGEHDGEGWAPRPDPGSTAESGTQSPVIGDAAAGGRPLEGVRVCDFTWIWAGPMCTQLLAHLGADVVRLESPEHLCLFRRLPFHPPELPLGPDTTGLFQTYNSDKRSLGIDLRADEARAIVQRLIERSDVVIDNFAVGTMADLGLGVGDVRAINPDIVVVSLSGYGQTGSSAGYMAYGPAGGAVSGLYAANGYEDGSPAETGVAIGDPGTGMTAAWATVAALVGRRRTGATARVDVAMVEAVATTIGELWMEYLATGEDPVPRGNADPGWAPHGVYPSAGDDQWVTIACSSDDAWRALCQVVDPALADDPRFATTEGRKANEAELNELIASWTADLDRWEATRRLQAVGVAAFPSVAPLELWTTDAQLDALGMLERPDHPVTGRRVVPGVPWRLTNGPNGIRRPAPCLGQHTDEVLAELGYDPAEIDRLAETGVVTGRAE